MKIDRNTGQVNWRSVAPSAERVEILFAGDFCTRYNTEQMLIQGQSKEVLAPIQTILNDKDLAVINLEAPLTRAESGIPKSGPNIKMDPQVVDFLTTAGFDICGLANNHLGDFGPAPVLETMEYLEEAGIQHVGAGANLAESKKPLIIEVKGIRLGILSYVENEFGIAKKDQPGTAPLNPVVNQREIKTLAEEVDLTIVLVHGGNERNPMPSPRVVDTYRSFVEAGADAVIGTHTHCPQGMEIYQGAPIIYSLGNFLFDRRPEMVDDGSMWWKSYLVKISFTKEEAVGVQVVPYSFGPDATKIQPLKGAEQQEFFRYLEKISEVIQDDTELQMYWYAWCAIHGQDWLKFLQDLEWPADRQDPQSLEKICFARNILSCEAHNELVTTYMRLVYQQQEQIADSYIPIIENLQRGIL